MRTIPILSFACLLLLAGARADQTVTAPPQPASGPGGAAYLHATVKESKYGTGGTEYHLFEPAQPVPESAPVIVFLHGWTAIDPWLYGAWIQHLVRRGNIVIHCRYQESALTPSWVFTPNMVSAVQSAKLELGQKGHVKPDWRRFAIAGHSVGGLLTANLAALCAASGLPEPRALMSVQPGRSMKTGRGAGVPMEDLSKVPGPALLLCITGEKDKVCGDADARRILLETTAIPAERKNLVTLTADSRGLPAMTGSHLAPCSIPADPPDAPVATGMLKRPPLDLLVAAAGGNFEPAKRYLATPEGRQWRLKELSRTGIGETFEPANAQDFALWRLFDSLCEAAFSGKTTDDALARTPASLSMGKWSDGTPVQPMRSGLNARP